MPSNPGSATAGPRVRSMGRKCPLGAVAGAGARPRIASCKRGPNAFKVADVKTWHSPNPPQRTRLIGIEDKIVSQPGAQALAKRQTKGRLTILLCKASSRGMPADQPGQVSVFSSGYEAKPGPHRLSTMRSGAGTGPPRPGQGGVRPVRLSCAYGRKTLSGCRGRHG